MTSWRRFRHVYIKYRLPFCTITLDVSEYVGTRWRGLQESVGKKVRGWSLWRLSHRVKQLECIVCLLLGESLILVGIPCCQHVGHEVHRASTGTNRFWASCWRLWISLLSIHKVSFFVLYNYVPNSEYVDPVEGPPEGQPSEGLTLWRLSHRVHRNYCFWLVVDFVISSKFT